MTILRADEFVTFLLILILLYKCFHASMTNVCSFL